GGIILLTSCKPGQKSLEDPDLGHGVFMHFLLEGLAGAADIDNNGQVTIFDLYRYASKKTQAYTRKFDHAQSPGLKGESEDFEIGLVRKERTNTVGMKLVQVAAGKFVMGSPAGEKDREDDESAHEVAITRPFFLGRHEVTLTQFRAFVQQAGYTSKS